MVEFDHHYRFYRHGKKSRYNVVLLEFNHYVYTDIWWSRFLPGNVTTMQMSVAGESEALVRLAAVSTELA